MGKSCLFERLFVWLVWYSFFMEKLFETQRIIVREWVGGDAHQHFEFGSDVEINRFMQFPLYKDIVESHERIAAMKLLYKQGELEGCDWAICLKESGRVIGAIGIGSHNKGGKGIVTIGYLLNSKFHGVGYMTEALMGMFGWIKERQIAWRIEAYHDIENVASGRVMQKAGMTREGVKRKGTFNNGNGRADAVMYSILYEEII